MATHYIALQYPEIKAGVSFCGVSVIRGERSEGSFKELWFFFLWCHAVIIREREDRHEIKSPVLFIFAENDNYIPLEQVGIQDPDLKFII